MAKCINPKLVDAIKRLPLSTMKTSERIKAFDDILGSGQGDELNLIYEKTLLLKKQENAFDKFIDNIDGTSLEKKAKIKKNLQERVVEKGEIIKNKELLSIVKETLDKKYDLDIPDESINKMFKLRSEIDELAKTAKGTADSSAEKLAWGKKIVELSDLVGDLKTVGKTPLDELKLSKGRIANKIIEKDYLGASGQTLVEIVNTLMSPTTKSIKAAWDASVLLRQGLKVLSADRKIWANQSKKSLNVWAKLFDKDAMEEIIKGFKADLVTRDLYQDAIKSKLALGVVEDFFPTSVVQKIKGLGNVFKASDDSFTMFSQGTRMDLFEKYVNLYKLNNKGVKPSKEIMDGFARVANSVTGRGGLGKFEAASRDLNKLLFSARFQTANINTVRHAFDNSLPKEARTIAREQLKRHLMLIGGLMLTFSTVGDVGWNPNETTFGKFRIPGTKKWISLDGGLLSYLSTTVRAVEKARGKQLYGQPSGMDILTDFLQGKLAPAPGVVRDLFEQRTYGKDKGSNLAKYFLGKKPTVGTSTASLLAPITIENLAENVVAGENAGLVTLDFILEFLGASTSEPKARREGSYDFIKN